MTKEQSDPEATAAAVEAARQGDTRAWDELFARAMPRLRAYAALQLGARLARAADVDDVVQETFLAASGMMDRFEPQGAGSFAAWLCRIAGYRIQHLADREGAAKRGGGALRDATVRLTAAIERLADGGDGPRTAAGFADEAEALRAAVAGLPDEDRSVLVLRYFEDRTLDEIAEATGRSEASVRRTLGRVVRNLGAALGGGRSA